MNRYDDVAAAAGFRICRDATRHAHEPPEGWVHFTHERFTDAGAFALLEIMHGLQDERPRGVEDWEWRYDRALWMLGVATKARLKLPRRLWELERARARESLSEYAGRVPAHARPEGYEKARRWSARS